MTPEPTKSEAKKSRRAPTWSISIARISGIHIRVHVTFLLLVVVFALGSSGKGGPGPVGGLIWLAIIFACIVVHELAHSFVARRRGATVHEIVLLPIGGVSKLENLPESPADEFAIAIVGPAASVALGGVAALFAWALHKPILPINLYGGPILSRLIWFNLIIGVFNLLPAFPMDGGRVFRSLLERRYDLEQSTNIAARVGRVFAGALVAVGVFWNLWLVFIGIFVYFGASAEAAATIIHLRLGGARVDDLMLLNPEILDPGMTVGELRGHLRRTAQRAFPIVGSAGYVGILETVAVERAGNDAHVGDLVAPAAPVLAPADEVEAIALPHFRSSHTKALAVLDHERVVGLLTVDDVAHLLTDRALHPKP